MEQTIDFLAFATMYLMGVGLLLWTIIKFVTMCDQINEIHTWIHALYDDWWLDDEEEEKVEP
jgi:hypothetical protein